MKSVFLFGLVFFLALLVGPANALEPFVPYDNFSTFFLNPDKWIGQEPNTGVLILENSRENVLGHLHFRSRVYTDSDGGGGFGGSRLNFAEADKVTAIKAKVQVLYVEAKGCATDPTNKFSRAAVRLGGYFFNTGPPPTTAGSAVNDVNAAVSVQRLSNSTDKPYILKVVAFVVKCLNSNCTQTTPIGSVDLGTTSLWSTVSVSIQWDKDNNQFIFALDGNPKTPISYGNLSDTLPPGLNQKRIEAQLFLPNCTGEPQPVAFIDAFLDDVYVNQGAAP